MARKHLFPLVVLLAAAVFAGLLAVSHTRALSAPAAATSSDPSIAFRLKKLDRFEQSLRKQLATAPATKAPTTVYRHAPASTVAAQPSHEDDHGDVAEYEDGTRDD